MFLRIRKDEILTTNSKNRLFEESFKKHRFYADGFDEKNSENICNVSVLTRRIGQRNKNKTNDILPVYLIHNKEKLIVLQDYTGDVRVITTEPTYLRNIVGTEVDLTCFFGEMFKERFAIDVLEVSEDINIMRFRDNVLKHVSDKVIICEKGLLLNNVMFV